MQEKHQLVTNHNELIVAAFFVLSPQIALEEILALHPHHRVERIDVVGIFLEPEDAGEGG